MVLFPLKFPTTYLIEAGFSEKKCTTYREVRGFTTYAEPRYEGESGHVDWKTPITLNPLNIILIYQFISLIII